MIKLENKELFQNWKEEDNKVRIAALLNVTDTKKSRLQYTARSGLLKAVNVLPLRKIVGDKTQASCKQIEGMWYLVARKQKLTTLEVLVELLPEGDLLDFLRTFCGLTVNDSQRVMQSIAQDNLATLVRKNSTMRGRSIKKVFWSGSPNSKERKVSDEFLEVGRAINAVSFSKIYTENLLSKVGRTSLNKSAPLTTFSAKEVSNYCPTVATVKVSHIINYMVLAGVLKKLPANYTERGAKLEQQKLLYRERLHLAHEEKEAKPNQTVDMPEVPKLDYVVPQMYILRPVSSVDWRSLLNKVDLDSNAIIRNIMITKYAPELADTLGSGTNRDVYAGELDLVYQYGRMTEENPQVTITKHEIVNALHTVSPSYTERTLKQHLKDILIWHKVNLVEITSAGASALGFNTESNNLKDKVLVNRAEYLRRK